MNQTSKVYLNKVVFLFTLLAKRVRQFLWALKYGSLFEILSKDIYCVGGFSKSRKAEMIFNGKRVYIGPNCNVGCRIEFYSSILIGPNVSFVGADHVYNDLGSLMFDSGRPEMKGIIIEDDVWAGHCAIIMDGVKLGRHSIIAAGSIVTKDTVPFSINAGCPSKVIKYRFDDMKMREEYLKNISYRISR